MFALRVNNLTGSVCLNLEGLCVLLPSSFDYCPVAKHSCRLCCWRLENNVRINKKILLRSAMQLPHYIRSSNRTRFYPRSPKGSVAKRSSKIRQKPRMRMHFHIVIMRARDNRPGAASTLELLISIAPKNSSFALLKMRQGANK